jgi:TolB protein
MQKLLLLLSIPFLIINLFGCSPSIVVYETISTGESFDALTQITESDKLCSYPNGGDFGDNLVFVSTEQDGSLNLYMKEKVLTKAIIEKTSGKNTNMAPSYCTANNRIAFQYWDKDNFDIYTIEADKVKAVTQITNTDEDEFNPSWSPDGNILIFEKGSLPSYYTVKIIQGSIRNTYTTSITKNQIWLKDLKTKELKMLGIGSFPRISPDGKHITCIRYDLDQEKKQKVGTLWIMSIDGENPKQITNVNLGNASCPNWSPDGKNIVFQLTKKNKEDADIYTIDTNGETLKQYTLNRSGDYQPYWSADNYIYFTTDRGGKAKQYQIWRFKIKK